MDSSHGRAFDQWIVATQDGYVTISRDEQGVFTMITSGARMQIGDDPARYAGAVTMTPEQMGRVVSLLAVLGVEGDQGSMT